MKKFLFGPLVLLIMAACTGKQTEKNNEDTLNTTDSLAVIEEDLKIDEEARIDSIRKDSIATTEKEINEGAEYNELLDQFAGMASELESIGKRIEETHEINYDYEKVSSIITNGGTLLQTLIKVKNKLTQEQLKKFNEAMKKWENNLSYFAD